MNIRFDVVIVGGGVMGASTAYWLSRFDSSLSIVVVERDPSHEFSSTALSVAAIRQQFSAPINVRISQFGLEFIRGFADLTSEVGAIDLGFRGNGYLFLAGSEGGAQTLRDNQSVQIAHGAQTELLNASGVGALYPWMHVDDIAIASFGGANEGWFDNMGLLTGLRALAKANGVQFRKGDVAGLDTNGGSLTGVELLDSGHVSAGVVVNAAGPRAASLVATLDEKFPVEPRKRTVFVVDAPNARHPGAPLIVDFHGIYARPEGDYWVTATVPRDDGPVEPDDFTPAYDDFEDVIWEKLYHRIPGFDSARVLRCWAGHYAFNTFDQNAIVGRHPDFENLFLINGFSGHGLQQAPAMGRGLAELILQGEYRSLDLSSLSLERVRNGKPVIEREVV